MSIKFSHTAGVWVEIVGKKRPGHEHRVMTRDDDGLCTRFMRWQQEQECYPLRTQSTGGGCWNGFFHIDDAERVFAWLSKQPDAEHVAFGDER